jgi:hypothetical protein
LKKQSNVLMLYDFMFMVHQHTILNFLDGISDMSDQRDRGRRVPLILHQPQDFCLDHGLAVCVATWHREVAAAAIRGVNAGFLFIGTASGFGIFSQTWLPEPPIFGGYQLCFPVDVPAHRVNCSPILYLIMTWVGG